jgi:hypothetical protein
MTSDEIDRLRAELVSKADELAATVRELRKVEAERDEARREWCEREAVLWDRPARTPQWVAKQLNWDCFKENTQ